MEQKYTAYKEDAGKLDILIFDDADTRENWIRAGYKVSSELTITEYWYRGERSVKEEYKEPVNKTS